MMKTARVLPGAFLTEWREDVVGERQWREGGQKRGEKAERKKRGKKEKREMTGIMAGH